MTTNVLEIKIAGLERQLAEIKEKVEELRREKPVQTFGDLYGIFAGQMDCTDEDLEAAKYQAKFDWLADDEKKDEKKAA